MGSSGKEEFIADKANRDFLRLFMAHQKRIYNFILMLVPNYSDADDIMQETATVLWSKFSEFERGTDFFAWAVSVARYKILNFRKKRGYNQPQFSADALERILNESKSVFDTGPDRARALQICLLKLSEKDRRLVAMRYEQDSSTKEVADRTGRSVGALYHTMARIHRVLQECITRTLSVWEMPNA